MILGVSAIGLTVGLFLLDLKRKKQSHSNSNKKSVKICLTGGPCGGKSKGVQTLSLKLKQFSVPCFIVPEAASIIGSAGFNFQKYSEDEIFFYQIYLMRLQINLESMMSSLAKQIQKKRKIKSVILCDRGLLDGKAYAHDQNWQKMLKMLNICEQQILNRYQGVIHLTTAADGAEQYYVRNKIRKQQINLAIKLDQEIKKSYSRHQYHYIIPNNATVHDFSSKMNSLWIICHQLITQHIETHDIIKYYNSSKK